MDCQRTSALRRGGPFFWSSITWPRGLEPSRNHELLARADRKVYPPAGVGGWVRRLGP